MAELVFDRYPAHGPITATFAQDFGRGPHRGVDVGCPVGTPVVAPAAGRVVPFLNAPTADYPGGTFGNGVCIDHPGTVWWSLYAHLSELRVAIGDTVAAGQLLGLSGNTGLTTGPHLHWQVCDSPDFPTDIGRSADPLSFMAPAQPGATKAIVLRVADGPLALRAGPDRTATLLRWMGTGMEVEIPAGAWVPVVYQGVAGWAFAEYLEVAR